MNHNSFNINHYIDKVQPNYINVFDELDQIRHQNIPGRFSFSIPEDDNFNLDDIISIGSTEDEKENDIKDIQDILDFSKSELLISSASNRTLYKCPPRKSLDARKIWKDSKIPRCAVIYDIESLLLDWAFTNAHLEIYNRSIKRIIWKSHSNCQCESTWKVFLQWIICATQSQ